MKSLLTLYISEISKISRLILYSISNKHLHYLWKNMFTNTFFPHIFPFNIKRTKKLKYNFPFFWRNNHVIFSSRLKTANVRHMQETIVLIIIFKAHMFLSTHHHHLTCIKLGCPKTIVLSLFHISPRSIFYIHSNQIHVQP